MSSLIALALATPIFGFSLTPPDASLLLPGGLVFAQVDAATEAGAIDASADDPAGDGDTPAASAEPADDTSAPAQSAEPADDASAPAAAPTPRQAALLAAAIRERQELATVNRAFGIATWGTMLVTVVLGFIQYYNLYGFFGGLEDTPCVAGGAVFGQDQCWGQPWAHRIAALTTTALYTTTFVLSLAMPDPLDADSGPGGEDLRIHEALRWVHLGGMVAQVLLGLAVGQNWFGFERSNDFGAMQALATVHQVVGLTTFGVLTAAGLIMLF